MEGIVIQIYLTNIHCNEETDEVGAESGQTVSKTLGFNGDGA